MPAVEQACLAWEACMRRDAEVIGRARVSAMTLAEIINGFVEPITYKTMAFFVLLIGSAFFLSNIAFGFARNRIVGRQLMVDRQVIGLRKGLRSGLASGIDDSISDLNSHVMD